VETLGDLANSLANATTDAERQAVRDQLKAQGNGFLANNLANVARSTVARRRNA
jgi:hypothetical protein